MFVLIAKHNEILKQVQHKKDTVKNGT